MADCIRVLLIDDDEDDVFITESLLDEAPGSFDLKWVPTYWQGLELLQQEHFDVCLVDYIIGGESGLDFVERAIGAGTTTPMILLTGVGQHDIDMKASEAGASDFLDKANLTATLIERAIRFSMMHSQALQDLAAQSVVMETTLESIKAGIATFDSSGRLMNSNSLFIELTADTTAFTRWSHDLVQLGTFGVEDAKARLLQAFETSAPENEPEFRIADGRVFDVRVDPIKGGGYVVVLIDVTAQRVLQRRILEAKQAAETANELKSAFLAKISHELRTPLNGVFGMAEILKLEPLSDRQDANLDRLVDSASALLALIEDLLDISIIEQGKFVLHEEAFDIHELINDASDIAQAASAQGIMKISTRVDLPRSSLFRGDRRRIVQVLVNFLSNAEKFASGTEVQISVQPSGRECLRFSVRDQGPGIENEQQDRIFNQFTQAECYISRKIGGVGLGLSIAKEIVQQMHGRIGVISTPGEGATFWFELPLDAVDGLTDEQRDIA